MMFYVVYYRVSDEKQGKSRLGLEAQQAMFAHFLTSRPGTVLGEYVEVETGKTLKKSQRRPELTKAIAHARAANAILVIAKIDRLARNVAFISTLMESQLPLVCCDMPEADKFTLHILAAVAEREGNLISERTSAALQALKARGVKLGSARPGHWDGKKRGWKKAQQVAKEAVQEEMSQRYEPLLPWIREMLGTMTYRQIVDALNAKGCKTRRDQPWNLATLSRVIKRYALSAAHQPSLTTM
jgi:DNA invertase Pin-like site-specific DNA recombinase